MVFVVVVAVWGVITSRQRSLPHQPVILSLFASQLGGAGGGCFPTWNYTQSLTRVRSVRSLQICVGSFTKLEGSATKGAVVFGS